MNKPETIADIRKEVEAKFRELIEAWMQRRSTFQTTLGTMQAFNNVFDRLDLAHKREIDELKKQVADLQQRLPKPDPNWRDICAKCFENGATEPPDCKYYTEDGCMSPIPDQHPLIQVSNAAKLREALGKLRAELWNNTLIAGKRKFELYEIADAALAAPPRNCDIYLTEEAVDAATATVRDCGACSRIDMEAPCVFCMVRWLLAPAKEGGRDGGK